MSSAGDCCFPKNVFLGGPIGDGLHRSIRLVIECWATPLWPIESLGLQYEGKKDDRFHFRNDGFLWLQRNQLLIDQILSQSVSMMARFVNLFWLWTILGTVIAWFYPPAFTWFLGAVGGLKIVSLGLGVIMLGMGITLTFADFKEVLKMPKWLVLGVLAQFLIMPCVGWGIATAFQLPDQFKLGIILVSCCPGGTASNVVTYLARGNLALSVIMTMCSTLLAVFLTPFLTQSYAAKILEVDAWAMVLTMVTIVLVPVLAGVALNSAFGNKLQAIKKIAPLVSVIVIVLIVGAIIGKTQDLIAENALQLLPAIFLVHTLGFALGYGWGWLFKMSERERRTFSIEVGMQNSGLGAELARNHFTVMASAPCAISAFYHCIIGSFLASIWRRKWSREDHQESAGISRTS